MSIRKPIAVVGMSYRLPKQPGVALWQSLLNGQNLVSRIDATRWAQDTYLHPRKSEPGTSYTFAAGSVGAVADFDAAFFGISPREAAQMDPQQRFLLELTWEALENAGIPPAAMRGSRCGVYIGIASTDYSYRRADDLASIDSSSMTGSTASIAANRISYLFDLRGPSMAIDTACSSALVAFHLACQSIASGESSAAVVGGISLLFHPFPFIGFSKASMLSRRGLCTPFDADGDGYVRSEGGGVFILKPLDVALANGDQILAVVEGSSVNCDGRTNGMTVPGLDAQASLLEETYRTAGIAASEIDYLEAHGTGTAVGDPIETRAIGQALGRWRPAGRPLNIGSIKSNLGHLEAASGVAGLVKAILCLHHRQIPPTIHLKTPNPNIRFDEWNLTVVTEPTPLDPNKRLVIGVNSFGFGGANAHVIITSPPEASPAPTLGVDRVPLEAPLILSARTVNALHEAARQLAAHLIQRPDIALYDAAYTSAFQRDQHEHRAVCSIGDRETVIKALQGFSETGEAPAVATGTALALASSPVFVYSGNGSQWAGMGRQLLEENETFAASLRQVDLLFSACGTFSIIDELLGEQIGERLELTEVAQPTLFAIQVGITELLRSRGVQPAAVVGHSVGEVAAAWACGALTLTQAVEVIHKRSAQQGTTRGAGGMTAVACGETDINEIIASSQMQAQIAVAGANSPRGVTIAGTTDALKQIERRLRELQISCRRLALDYAFHSPAMESIRQGVKISLADLRPSSERLPFYSTVTGGSIAGEQLDGRYWWKNIREPVRFQAAIESLLLTGHNVFIEIGPHAVLKNYVGDCLRQASIEGRVLTTMLRSKDGLDCIVETVQQLIVAGAITDLKTLFPTVGRRVDLPSYPWQHETFWHPVTSESYRLIERRKEHPLLGYRLHESEYAWENHIDTRAYPIYRDHVVGDVAVFPAAAYIEMALAASERKFGPVAHEIEALEIRAPLLLEESSSKSIRFSIDNDSGQFSIRSRTRLSDEPWVTHVVGRLLGKTYSYPSAAIDTPSHAPTLSKQAHYQLAQGVGLSYGPAFQAVENVWINGSEILAQLTVPEMVKEELTSALLHPALLDSSFQILVDLLHCKNHNEAALAFVPIRIGRIVLHQARHSPYLARAEITIRSPRSVMGNFTLFDSAGSPIASLEEVRFRAVPMKRSSTEHLRSLGYHAIPSPHPLTRHEPWLPPVGDFLTVCNAHLQDTSTQTDRRRYYDEVEPLFDILCTGYAERAVQQLVGALPIIDTEALILSGALNPDRRALFTRLLDILEEDGLLEPTEGGRRWTTDTDLPSPEDSWLTLLGDYPEHAAQILRIGRIGTHLANLLSDAKAGALGDGIPAANTLSQYARPPSIRRAVTKSLVATVGLALDRLPEGQRLRIVEFTTGDGDLSTQLLSNLDPDRCDYVIAYRDESAANQQKSTLVRFPHVVPWHIQNEQLTGPRPALLDHGADFAIVSGGLAEFDDSAALLLQIALLLEGGGMLAVVDQHPSRWADLAFGASPDWWTGELGSPPAPRLRTAAAWSALVNACGFENAACANELPGANTGLYVLLARAKDLANTASVDSPPASLTWVLVQDEADYAGALGGVLANELSQQGHRVVVLAPGEHQTHQSLAPNYYRLDVTSATALSPLLSTLTHSLGEIHGIVHLAGLEISDITPDAVLQQQEFRCASLVALLQACESASIRPAISLVTMRTGNALLSATGVTEGCGNAPPDAALAGLGRTVQNEYPHLRVRLIDLNAPDQLERMAAQLLQELLAPDPESEILLTGKGRYVPRLRALPLSTPTATVAPIERTRVRLDFVQPGPLKNLEWKLEPLPELPADGVEIEVRAAGLNFRDVMYAMGLLSDEAVENGFAGPTLGMELSGVVVAVGASVHEYAPGDEVIAFAPASFATHAITTAGAVVRKPAEWTFEAAATVPTTFFTVYYALCHLARLQAGEKILIHGAAGGVGIAAIQMAKHLGAEIFATAGSDEKRDFVHLLGADHVFDSRTLAFADDILRATDGKGVDVVLNSLAGEAIRRNFSVLKPFGRFLELGKRDFYENTQVGLRPFRNNISYFGIDADQLMRERPELTTRLFRELMALFTTCTLKPLPYRAFPAAEAVEAFRYMQQSRQIGKVVLSFRDAINGIATAPAEMQQLQLSGNATYLVTGGLSGFGLKTAQWLVAKGARHLVLLGRRGLATPGAEAAVTALTATGINVKAIACDITQQAAVAAVFADLARDMPPLKGVIHAAMVIADGLVRTMTANQLHTVLAPKILGACHLDALTRDLQLDFFVLYSSATTAFGNPGQGNYVAANRYLEALAESRRALRLPAIAVSWGAIDDVGYLARNAQVKDALQARMGGAALSSDAALDVLERLILSDRSGLAILDLDWNALRRFLPTATAPKYRELAREVDGNTSGASDGHEDIARWLAELSTDELAATIGDLLKKEVGDILQISPTRLDANRSLYDIGMDSLMGVELMTAVENRFGINLPVMALSEGPTINKLADRIVAQLKGTSDETGEGDAEQIETKVRHVAQQHMHPQGDDINQSLVTDISLAIEFNSRASSSGKREHT